MDLSVPTFKQREIKELLECMMTEVENHRHRAGQKYELAKRKATDADIRQDRLNAQAEELIYQQIEADYKTLQLELKVLLENFGVGV